MHMLEGLIRGEPSEELKRGGPLPIV
jgi:hypothetical protein